MPVVVDEEDPLLHVSDPLLGSASIYDLNTWEELKDLLSSSSSSSPCVSSEPTTPLAAMSPYKAIHREEWNLDEFILQEEVNEVEERVLFEKVEDGDKFISPKGRFKKSRKERLVARRKDEAGVQILVQGSERNKENIYFCSSENFILRPMTTTHSYSCSVRSSSTSSSSMSEGSLPRRRTVNILKRQLKSQEKRRSSSSEKEILAKEWPFLESGTWTQIEEVYYGKS